ncbi:MAG: CaiB/BaiF CoA transferase family protein [Candidatus Hydrothermia bacterium]
MKPLEGVKVLDLSRVLAGPTAGMILGDLGADVIKVEKPGEGDETRGWGPPFAGGESAYYMCANKNKRSITLNLKSPEGREILEKLIKRSDVVLLNFLPDVLEKLRLTYQDVKNIKEDIIWASITGFGLTGPKASKPGYDVLIQGISGLMSITGEPDGEPMKVGVAICDVLTALYTVIAVEAALIRRSITGQGAMIDNSLLEASIASLVNVANNYLIGGIIPKRYGNAHPNIVPYQVFKASDGYIIIGVGNEEQWKRFCKVLEREDLATDPRFETNAKRLENRNILIPIIEEIIKQKPSDYWLKKLDEAHIPAGPINTVDRAINDEQVKARNFIQEINHPTAGRIKLMKNPIHFGDIDLDIYRHPPLLGEHTEEILTELGYSKDDIKVLREKGVI